MINLQDCTKEALIQYITGTQAYVEDPEGVLGVLATLDACMLATRPIPSPRPKPRGYNAPVRIQYDEALTTTDLAILYEIDANEVWIPKSQIRELDEDLKTVVVPFWLADKNELMTYAVG